MATSGLPNLLFPTFVVSMKERTAPSSCARNVSEPPLPEKSGVNFGLTTLFDFVSLQISNFSGCMSVNWNKLLQQAWYHHLDWAAAIFLMVWQERERIDQVVTHSLRCRVRSEKIGISAVTAVLYAQDSPSNHTGRHKPKTTSCTACAQKRPTKCSLQAGNGGNEGVRQGDTSLTFDWHDDPLQQVRALPQKYAAQCSVGPCLLALPHCSIHSPCPQAELAIFH